MSTPPAVAKSLAALMRRQLPADLSDLAFRIPDPDPNPAELDGLNRAIGPPGSGRPCCMLGALVTPDVTLDGVRGKHSYGGTGPFDGVGHIYTSRGGFVDLGHARDYIDYTRFLATKVRHAPLTGDELNLGTEGAQLKLKIHPRSALPTPSTCAMAGAAIAYQRAVWHELATYLLTYGTGLTPERYSSFSPEDNFSNALGCLVGYRAVLEPLLPSFDGAADLHLVGVLHDLGAVEEKVTELALECVDGYWFSSTDSLRRHLDAIGTIRPWLVTDTSPPDKAAKLDQLRDKLGTPAAAPITLPSQTPDGQPLDTIAELEFVGVADSELAPLLTIGPASVATAADLQPMITALRSRVRADYPFGDERG